MGGKNSALLSSLPEDFPTTERFFGFENVCVWIVFDFFIIVWKHMLYEFSNAGFVLFHTV